MRTRVQGRGAGSRRRLGVVAGALAGHCPLLLIKTPCAAPRSGQQQVVPVRGPHPPPLHRCFLSLVGHCNCHKNRSLAVE